MSTHRYVDMSPGIHACMVVYVSLIGVSVTGTAAAQASRQSPAPLLRTLPQVEQIAPALPAPTLAEAEQSPSVEDPAIAQLPPEPRAVRQPRPAPKYPSPASAVDVERAYVTLFGPGDARTSATGSAPALDPDTQGYLAARIAAAAGAAVTDADAHPVPAPVPVPAPKVPKP
jgi:hypothetical protein